MARAVKPMIFAAIERGGEARAAVVPPASAVVLDPLMFGWFDRNGVLCTDELAVYDWFTRKMRKHYRVNHARGEDARSQGGVRVHVLPWSSLPERGRYGQCRQSHHSRPRGSLPP